MTRSRKMSGKKTVKQLSAELDELKGEFARFANAAATDIMKLNHLVYAMLDEQGKITKITCTNCGQEAVQADIEGVEQSEQCPHCGQNLHEATQTTLEMIPTEGDDSEE